MRVLVTGGAGFIGSHLVRRLTASGASVCVLDNLHRGTLDALTGTGADFVEGDIRDSAIVRRASSGVEIVYHLAAQSNVMGALKDRDYAFTTNVTGAYNVLNAAHDAGARRLIFTSSREVYGDVNRLPVPETAAVNPKNPYGISKACGELACRVFDSTSLDTIILRLANVYGPGDRDRVIPLFIDNALGGHPLVIYGTGKVLDFVWVEDVVDALIRAGKVRGGCRPINIGTGYPVELPALAERILHLTGSRSRIEHAPARSVEIDRYVACIDSARELLEFSPEPQALSHLPEVIGSMPHHKPGM
jgi:nucleoside-diphosphate-sugar epimerase